MYLKNDNTDEQQQYSGRRHERHKPETEQYHQHCKYYSYHQYYVSDCIFMQNQASYEYKDFKK